MVEIDGMGWLFLWPFCWLEKKGPLRGVSLYDCTPVRSTGLELMDIDFRFLSGLVCEQDSVLTRERFILLISGLLSSYLQ